MRRKALGLTLLSALIVGGLMGSPAPAKGDPFEFDRNYFFAGAEVKMRSEEVTGAVLQQGPLYLYLLEKNRDWVFSEQDFQEGIVLGKAQTTPPDGFPIDLGKIYELTLSFEVPDVPVGEYAASVCELPCTKPLYGWAIATPVRVVGSRLEARLLERMEALNRSSYRFQYRQHVVRAQEDRKLSRRIHAVRTEASRDARRLQESLGAARRAAEDEPGWPGIIALVFGAVVMSTVMTLLLTRRRREAQLSTPVERIIEESESAGRV